jgi:hypothetical protein
MNEDSDGFCLSVFVSSFDSDIANTSDQMIRGFFAPFNRDHLDGISGVVRTQH